MSGSSVQNRFRHHRCSVSLSLPKYATRALMSSSSAQNQWDFCILSLLSKIEQKGLMFFLSASVKMEWLLLCDSALLKSKNLESPRWCSVSASVRNISLPCNMQCSVQNCCDNALCSVLLFCQKYKTASIHKIFWLSVQSLPRGLYVIALLRLSQNCRNYHRCSVSSAV